MLESPCKGCPDRFVGCHSQCEGYLSYVEEKDKQTKRMRKIKYDEDQVLSIITKKKGR